MTKEQLKNKIAFQIGFLMHSNKPAKDVVEHLTEIAEQYADEKEEEQCTPTEK